jgi:hypothetical protein
MSRIIFLDHGLKLNINTHKVIVGRFVNASIAHLEKTMSQESNVGYSTDESAKKAILERLSYPNLSLDDLLAAQVFAEIAKCESNVMASIADRLKHLKN